MNTKQVVWNLFNEWILPLPKKGKEELTFDELIYIIKNCGSVYDNRTMKNYFDCCINNEWLIPDGDNLLEFYGSSTSVYKYKRVKLHINKDAKFEGRTKEELMAQILSGEQKSFSDKAIENAKVRA